MNPFSRFSSASSRPGPCARILSRPLLALAAASWVALASAGAWASPIGFQADYLTLSTRSCILSNCFPGFPPPGNTFQKTFSLDSSQLAVDGSYDVLASLAPAYPSTPGTTLNATAFVTGGAVTDLVVHYFVVRTSGPGGLFTTGRSSFDASGGSWTSNDSSLLPLAGGCSSCSDEAGTYTITQVPEPASVALASFGLAAMAAARRPRPLSPYCADRRRGRSR